jgi:hypothetical protein
MRDRLNDELIDALWNDFPTLFEGETQCISGTFKITKKTVGFDCGNGWEPFVRKALQRLADLGPEIRVTQVKQKLAGLTIYFDCPKELETQCHEIVREADLEAARTCEECGKPGLLRKGGWEEILCEEHAEGRQALCRSCQGRAPRLWYQGPMPPDCPDCGRQLMQG